jgi:hypothetical protein
MIKLTTTTLTKGLMVATAVGVPSLFGELQVCRLLLDLDAAGCWLGPANGNL